MGMNKGQARARTIELLKMVGIPNAEERVDQYPHQFSGGMRQRVMIAMALSCNPKLLIADEPTTALDVTIQAQTLDLMRTLQMERDTSNSRHPLNGRGVGMADRIQVMYAGHIVETGIDRRDLCQPRHPYTVGLLKSIPRLDAMRKEKLEPIRGLPPRPDRSARYVPICAALQLRTREVRTKKPASAGGQSGSLVSVLVLGRGEQGVRPRPVALRRWPSAPIQRQGLQSGDGDTWQSRGARSRQSAPSRRCAESGYQLGLEGGHPWQHPNHSAPPGP